MQKCVLYHAPWSKVWRTHVLRGSYAWELQFGPWVFQVFYDNPRLRGARHGRFHVWRDMYTHTPSYLRSALWGTTYGGGW